MSNPIRIAFLGGAGYGKTTIVQALSDALKLPFVNIATRDLAEKYQLADHDSIMALTDRGGDIEKYFDFHRDLIVTRALEYRHRADIEESFITDRTPVCSLVYTLVHGSARGSDQTIDHMRREAQRGMRAFTHVFVIEEPHGGDTADGFRIDKSNYNQMYTDLVIRELERAGVSFIKLQAGSVKSRLETCLTQIQAN